MGVRVKFFLWLSLQKQDRLQQSGKPHKEQDSLKLVLSKQSLVLKQAVFTSQQSFSSPHPTIKSDTQGMSIPPPSTWVSVARVNEPSARGQTSMALQTQTIGRDSTHAFSCESSLGNQVKYILV